MLFISKKEKGNPSTPPRLSASGGSLGVAQDENLKVKKVK